jgi:hypothetical protein
MPVVRRSILGDHALHLYQQRRLRIVARRRTLQKPDLDPQALELLEDQHLVGVGAGQAIDAQAQYLVEHARLGSITHAIERGAIQPRARITIVDELLDHLMPISPSGSPQRLKLRADRATLLLALGRHAGVEPDSHSPTARNQ